MKSIRKMLTAVTGEDRAIVFQTQLETLRVGDKVIISRNSMTEYRAALVRNGKTVSVFVGPFREVFESAMRMADPETLDGVRMVRKEPGGAKVY